MDKLDTYNHVQNLEAPSIRRLLNITYLLLVTIFVLGCSGLWLSENPPPYSFHVLFVTVIIFIIVLALDRFRKKRCQFCGGRVSESTKPLILTTKYLSLRGIKQGDYFYMQRIRITNPFSKRWIKVCNLSLTCHHCRLVENKQHECFEQVSIEEQDSMSLNK